jgi:FtsP/CotA-like multicopper oxidase with cupredoxin domain
MMIDRRQFLSHGLAATTALSALSPRAFASATASTTDSATDILRAAPVRAQIAPSPYPETEIWAYGGTLPGTEIRLRQGAPLRRVFDNALPEPSTIHWHGIRLDNAMDGVAGLTQEAVAPGAQFTYEFTPPDAGTYWYHAHTRSFEQVARGLYGPLIIEEAEPPQVDGEEVLVLDDLLLNPETAQFDPDFEAPHDRSHAGRLGNLIVTNGQFALRREVQQHARLRLRLINAANARVFTLGLSGLEGWVMALDGMPLATPLPASEPLALGPGQRADLFVDVVAAEGEIADLVQFTREGGLSQVAFAVTGRASLARRDAPAPLPPNPAMEVTGLAGARRLAMPIEGGAMGGLRAAQYQGREQGMGDLVAANQFWALGGIVGLSDAPLAEIARGETVQLDLDNRTAFPHAMHLHGMHFREVLADGSFGPMRDTILMQRGERRSVAFMADNPGKWLFHCHMLGHAASGMTSWIEVS